MLYVSFGAMIHVGTPFTKRQLSGGFPDRQQLWRIVGSIWRWSSWAWYVWLTGACAAFLLSSRHLLAGALIRFRTWHLAVMRLSGAAAHHHQGVDEVMRMGITSMWPCAAFTTHAQGVLLARASVRSCYLVLTRPSTVSATHTQGMLLARALMKARASMFEGYAVASKTAACSGRSTCSHTGVE